MIKQTIYRALMCLGFAGLNLSCHLSNTARTTDRVVKLDSNSYKVFLISDEKLRCLHPQLNHKAIVSCKRAKDGNTLYIFTKDMVVQISPEESRVVSSKPNHIVDMNGNLIAKRTKDALVFPSDYSIPVDPFSRYDFTVDGVFYFIEKKWTTNLFSVKHPEMSLLTISDFSAPDLFQAKTDLYLIGIQGSDQKYVLYEIEKIGGGLRIVRKKTVPSAPWDISPDGKLLLLLERFAFPPVLFTYVSTYEIDTGKSRKMFKSYPWGNGIFVTTELWNRLEQLAKEGGYSGKMEFHKKCPENEK